jgi:predicted transcriptional regulator
LSGAKLLEELDFTFHISTYRLGKEANIDPGHLYNIRKGKKNLGLKAAIKILAALDRINREAAYWFSEQLFRSRS